MKRYIQFFVMVGVCCACGESFLDMKRNTRQVIPEKISDYQALLDRNSTLNGSPCVELALLSSDEYNVSDQVLSSVPEYYRNTYLWQPEIFAGTESNDWNNAYQRIMYANLALDVGKLRPTAAEQDAWNNVKGSALFFRSFAFFQLAQLFCKPYDPTTASMDMGIPLRTDYDVSVKYGRSTVKEVYDRIVADLTEAINLLPDTSINKFRPSKLVACFVLANVYMHMGNYPEAYRYSDRALAIKNDLIDYNTLDASAAYTFPYEHDGGSILEVLMYLRLNTTLIAESRVNVDSNLLELYHPSDLRKGLYFRQLPDGRTIFKGAYSGPGIYFTGLATDELWLIRAESQIRTGRIEEGMTDIYHLLEHRYRDDDYLQLKPENEEEALRIVIEERRKELFMRGTRWGDLRRWNSDSRFRTGLERRIDGTVYELPPGDPRWTFPIPDNEIDLGDLKQNVR